MNISSINPTTNIEITPDYSAPRLNLNIQFTSFDDPTSADIKATVQKIKTDNIEITIKPTPTNLLLSTLDETLFQVVQKQEELNKLKTELDLSQKEIIRLKEELQDIHEYTFQTYKKEMSIVYNYAVIALQRFDCYKECKEKQTLNEKQLSGLLGSIYKPLDDLLKSCIQYICNRRPYIGELLRKSILEKSFNYERNRPGNSKNIPREQEEKNSIHPQHISPLNLIYDNAKRAMNAYLVITGAAVRSGTPFTINQEESILRCRLSSIKENITRADIGLGLRVVRNVQTSR